MMYVELVRETGVEPARAEAHGILSPRRLPIPPLPHITCRLFRAANTITLLCNLL